MDTAKLPNLNFCYDPLTDTITIEGIKYSGSLFRDFGGLLPKDKWFRIVGRQDGVITLESKPPIAEAE